MKYETFAFYFNIIQNVNHHFGQIFWKLYFKDLLYLSIDQLKNKKKKECILKGLPTFCYKQQLTPDN